jgi:hypothetical protein
VGQDYPIKLVLNIFRSSKQLFSLSNKQQGWRLIFRSHALSH